MFPNPPGEAATFPERGGPVGTGTSPKTFGEGVPKTSCAGSLESFFHRGASTQNFIWGACGVLLQGNPPKPKPNAKQTIELSLSVPGNVASKCGVKSISGKEVLLKEINTGTYGPLATSRAAKKGAPVG